MKFLLISMFVAVLGVTAHEQNLAFNIGNGDRLLLVTEPTLAARAAPAQPGRPALVIMQDKQRICQMRLVFGKPETLPSKETLESQLRTGGQKLLANSVEEKLNIKELKSAHGTLFYFELEDKREQSGDGRYTLQGVGTIGDYACQFMQLSKQKTSEVHEAILEALSSMRIAKARR